MRNILCIFLIFGVSSMISAQCPPKNTTPNCDCSTLLSGEEAEKIKVTCSGVGIGDFASWFHTLGPLDVTLQKGGFTSLSSQLLSVVNVGKLTLIGNGIERISVGDFKGIPSLHDVFISEPGLRLVDDLAFVEVPSLQRLTISDSTTLERFPKLKNLPNLSFVSFTNNSVRFLEAGAFSDLPALREIDLRSNKIDIFDISTFGQHLDNLRKLDLTGNAISDLSFLPLALRNLPNLNSLFLQSNGISQIPLGFFDGLNSILTVDFSKNQITKLPDQISTNSSSTLRELYLGQNYITQIPPNFFQHTPNLRTLSLCNNSINILDAQLIPLKDLLYLRLEGNKLQRISNQAFTTLSRLQILSLDGNQLTVLENGVFTGLDSLLTLDLSRNYLTEFHGMEIKNLSTLQTLLFAGNKLRNLYAGFESLTSLKRLDLSSNQISNIDDNTFLSLKSLEQLQLEGNLFMKLPLSALEKLPALERLTVSNNHLLRLPVMKAIGHLKHLALDHNSIPEITAGTFQNLPELRQLLLNDNRITTIAEGAFTNLYTLYVLDLSDNAITGVPAKVFDNLVSLETLNLASNHLGNLQDGTLGNLPNLRSVDFSRNEIAAVQDGAFRNVPHLMQFNISRNLLNTVPSAVSRLGKLRRLDLSSNRIRRVEVGAFTTAEKLENLHLQRNPICFLAEKSFSGNTVLSYLDLSYTDLRHVPQSAFRANQDWSGVMLDGVSVDCDCNTKWLRALKPNVRCGFPGAVMQMKLSQINPEFMTCQLEDKGSVEQCVMLPIAVKPIYKTSVTVAPPTVTTVAGPDTQILAKGSMTQAWMTRAEIEAKSQEFEASQAAKLVGLNGGSSKRRRMLDGVCFIVLSSIVIRRLFML